MDVFGEGHRNEVYSRNTISASLIKHLLIVYICVIRKCNKRKNAPDLMRPHLWLLVSSSSSGPPVSLQPVFLIISPDTGSSGQFTLLYLRDGGIEKPYFHGWLSANHLANDLNRSEFWGSLEKTVRCFYMCWRCKAQLFPLQLLIFGYLWVGSPSADTFVMCIYILKGD